MPRRDDDEFDSYDDRPRKSKGAFPVWLIVLLCAVPLGLIALVVGGVALFSFRGAAEVQQAEAMRVDAAARDAGKAGIQRVYTRDEFRAMVIGKTGDEVIAVLGRPNFTSDNPDGSPDRWVYDKCVLNPATNKYENGTVDFINGRSIGASW